MKKAIIIKELINFNNFNIINIIKKKISRITFYNIDEDIINNIYIKYGIKIDEVIVRKEFLNSKKLIPHGGNKTLFDNEINNLITLNDCGKFPKLLYYDKTKRYTITNYCGESITKENLPDNWKMQLKKIIIILKKKKIYHNDMILDNFLVKDNAIILIDFGWASSKVSYPKY